MKSTITAGSGGSSKAENHVPRLKYPEGYISDPVERSRIAKELRGSIPDIMTQEEFRKMRELP